MHSEIGAPTDRRTRKRAARRDALLDLAADLVEQHGVDGVTMAALAEAADYAPASLYTYFSSRSALLAALQQRALATLGEVARDHLAAWDAVLDADPGRDGEPPDRRARVHALARLLAFSELFLTAPEHHPREFRLQQQLLVTPGAEDTADAATVVPSAMAVLEIPRQLLAAATDRGALDEHEQPTDPLGQPIGGAVGLLHRHHRRSLRVGLVRYQHPVVGLGEPGGDRLIVAVSVVHYRPNLLRRQVQLLGMLADVLVYIGLCDLDRDVRPQLT